MTVAVLLHLNSFRVMCGAATNLSLSVCWRLVILVTFSFRSWCYSAGHCDTRPVGRWLLTNAFREQCFSNLWRAIFYLQQACDISERKVKCNIRQNGVSTFFSLQGSIENRVISLKYISHSVTMRCRVNYITAQTSKIVSSSPETWCLTI
jgi:hypothetical protein